MIIVFTGNGKGKTTAALGQAMRAMGRDRRALIIQFIKGPWISGEDEFISRLQKLLERHKESSMTEGDELDTLFFNTLRDFAIKKMGLGFVGILDDELPREKHEEAAQNALRHFEKELAKNKWDLLVLDEINNAIGLNLITVENVLPVLKKVPERTLVILTGRNAPPEFIEIADLATEMREIKHPFNQGKSAKSMIEF